MDRAQRLAGQRALGRGDAGDAEISHLDAAVLQNHDVVGLDVPVDDAPAVGVLQRLGDLGGEVKGLPPAELNFLFQILLEGDALDQLHDDIVAVAGMGYVIDAYNVGVGEHRDRLRFRVEAAAEFRVLRILVL